MTTDPLDFTPIAATPTPHRTGDHPMTTDPLDPIAEAQGWIADHLLSDEQRAQEESRETGTGEDSWELDLDRSARIMQALLPAVAVLVRFADDNSTAYVGLGMNWLTLDGTVDITPDEYTALLALIPEETP